MGLTMPSLRSLEEAGLLAGGRTRMLDFGPQNLYTSTPAEVLGSLRKYAREGKLHLAGEARATRIRRSELEALMAGTKSGDDRPDVATEADVIIAKLKRRG